MGKSSKVKLDKVPMHAATVPVHTCRRAYKQGILSQDGMRNERVLVTLLCIVNLGRAQRAAGR